MIIVKFILLYRSQLRQYQNKQEPVYEAPDQEAFYEDVSKLGMGGPPTAIKLSECPAYAPNESGGGQRR